MSDHIKKTIADFQGRVHKQEEELRSTKRLVNELCLAAGMSALYPDTELESSSITSIRKDQFYGQPLATAIRQYLDMRHAANMGAASTREIFDTLVQGGYKFETKSDANAMRSLQISLSKNQIFHRIGTGQSTAWGMTEWYPKAKPDKNGGDADDGNTIKDSKEDDSSNDEDHEGDTDKQ